MQPEKPRASELIKELKTLVRAPTAPRHSARRDLCMSGTLAHTRVLLGDEVASANPLGLTTLLLTRTGLTFLA